MIRLTRISRVVRDDILSATITIVACYLCFYIAEFTFIKVSGILSIVVLGLFMSAFGKAKIYPESEHAGMQRIRFRFPHGELPRAACAAAASAARI